MRWREALAPVAMCRVAVVGPATALRAVLVQVADAGLVELDSLSAPGEAAPGEAARRLARMRPAEPVQPQLAPSTPDLDALERAGRADLLAGEAALAEHAADAVVAGPAVAWLGWAPADEVAILSARLAPVGAAVVPLPRGRGVEPPTATRPGPVRTAFSPLVRTYATVPYADVDPTVLAGLAYVVMFGAMFGDVGHGSLLVLAGLLARTGRPRLLARLRPHWMLITAAGAASMIFGLGYGEAFGPTGLVPVLWLAPMEETVQLLISGVALGAVLLAGAYTVGVVNRVREAGWAVALYAPSGLAGALLFLAGGLGLLAWRLTALPAAVAAGVLAATALTLAFVGFLVAGGGGAAGALQAVVELVDMVIRLGANVVSFARLAAFGLTHAVLGWIVWEATGDLWRQGPLGAVGGVAVFALGNALAFALEALVAGVQALRLEYYELFSRVFRTEGRPFQPWHIPTEVS
jgi:V/A-type H+-transporting ATPase subunit I